MGLLELLLLAIGLSMDAFAVSICKGLSIKELKLKHMVIVGLWFGGFQALMPLLGYLLGLMFKSYITSFDHWIAFILLSIIGINMIRESFEPEKCDTNNSLGFKSMLILSIATSIDALAVGITFAFLKVNIVLAISFIGFVTFFLSMLGVKGGHIFGLKYKSKAVFAGGIILILLGLKILLQHIGILL